MLESKKDKQPLVLRELAKHGSINRAAKKAGVCRQTIWRWEATDKAFKAQYKTAMKQGRG